MRSMVAMVSAAALLLAQVPVTPGFAQGLATAETQQTAVNPAIVEAFKTFPQGGAGLSSRLSDLIVANRKLAPEMARYVQTAPGLSYAQKIAAEHGLASALDRMGIKAQKRAEDRCEDGRRDGRRECCEALGGSWSTIVTLDGRTVCFDLGGCFMRQ
jgi:hypothetical protein